MANKRERTIKAAVEAQCGSLRTLAQAMRVHADSLGALHRSERKIVAGWVEMIDELAVALSEAVALRDTSALQRLWAGARVVVLPLTFVAGTSADSLSLWDHFAAEPSVSAPATDALERCAADQVLLDLWVTAVRVDQSSTRRFSDEEGDQIMANLYAWAKQAANLAPPDDGYPDIVFARAVAEHARDLETERAAEAKG